jgi:hypothetical protein
MHSDAPAGIVTLTDSNYFAGLMLLHRSVQECWPVPIACFDIGLTEEQKRTAGGVTGLDILPLPNTAILTEIKTAFGSAALLAKRNKRVWPLWSCPFLIAAAPFRRVFWIDSDIAVLRNLDQLFVFLDDGPVFTLENNAPAITPNKPELYDLLPITRPFDPLEPRVNAGVSGWDLVRDASILEAYMYPVRRACADSRIRDAISWHDQGALVWAIQSTGMQHRVLPSTSWNLCVRHTALGTHPLSWDEQFVGRARREVPEANLLHWNGAKVPWAT